jgi:hypothetical protein
MCLLVRCGSQGGSQVADPWLAVLVLLQLVPVCNARLLPPPPASPATSYHCK